MAKLHCFDGDKGGIGKSFAATVFIQYYLDHKYPFVPCEADRYNPDVSNRYQDLSFQFAVFSEDEQIEIAPNENPDLLLDLAVEQDVIVSLPAQVGLPFGKWLNTAIVSAQEVDVQIVRWFLTSGTYESLNLFYKALESHGRYTPFVLVKNWGLTGDWSQLTEDKELQQLIKQYKVQVIDFPKLDFREMNLIQKNNWTFAQAREAKELTLMQRTRVKTFLKTAYSAFESTGLLTHVAHVA